MQMISHTLEEKKSCDSGSQLIPKYNQTAFFLKFSIIVITNWIAAENDFYEKRRWQLE